ncbi:predicted protein [Naegleria gruberi]|uniref:Predicted protein n=1 Tax=Naegleria gruberi TaxID=5762 RepID=D2VNX4_NAEGR|nr:uncharacterized protein NAEGRDRAFT_70652 [Naegleria gruberi]EFC41567.1 predicted protein [Naegleria gruberi]|eukprot:XP_002674311.1 predicted protein [Naegleria gruberi strain NEG-M]
MSEKELKDLPSSAISENTNSTTPATTSTTTIEEQIGEEKSQLVQSEVDLESQVFEDDEIYSSNQPLIGNNDENNSETDVNSSTNSEVDVKYFDQSIFKIVYKRGIWLILLLILQSFSSFILAKFESLIEKHIIISLFLTMLIGTGGNSGSQTVIEIVRRITTGEFKKSNIFQVVWREFRIGILLSLAIGLIAFLRVYIYRVFSLTPQEAMGMSPFIAIFYNPTLLKELIALTLSVIMIVIVSVFVCALIPLFIHFVLKFDAGISSGPMSSVVMDLLGVTLTVLVCSLLL